MALSLLQQRAPSVRDDQLVATVGDAPSLLDGGAASPARTLVNIFEATVESHPSRIAVDDGTSLLTYAELDSSARQLASRLAEVGIGRGDRVGIRVPDGMSELYVGVLGTLIAGAAYVPVDVADPEARAEEIWKEASVAAVLGARLELTVSEPGRGAHTGPARPQDDCWVIFTSGSTGKPKGVAVTHRSAAAFVDAEATLFRVHPHDRVMAALSIGFDASCEEMWLAWRNGAALVPVPRAVVRSGTELGPLIAERRITVVSTVPTLAAMLDSAHLGNVRLLILGGEACSDQLGTMLASHVQEAWNTYGPTEATVVTTAARIFPGEPVCIGRPIPGWQAAVVDVTGQLQPLGEPGELIIGGVGLARYLDRELDRTCFAELDSVRWPRCYRTGDLVRATRVGLEYLGRLDDQVKIGGRRIELGEIEARLHAVPGVRQAAAGVRRTEAGDMVLVAWFVGDASPADVRDEIAAHLPAGVVPTIVPLSSFPTRQAGKVDRAALPWPPPDDGAAHGLTPTESFVAALWKRHLGVRPTAREDDFFQLGGASLGAARVTSDLRQRYPSFGVSEIYSHRRLGDLAARLDELAAPALSPPSPGTRYEPPRGGILQLLGAVLIVARTAPEWVVSVLALDDVFHARGLPYVSWPWLLIAWLLLISAPGEVLMVAALRWLLLRNLKPGRYPRRSVVATKVWFVDRLAQQMRVLQYAGTPWAERIARLLGIPVGTGARLGTIPSPVALVRIGSKVTLEADVDLGTWWVEGPDLIVGTIDIADGARVGTRSILMPGTSIGEGAEIEAGTVIIGRVPAGERWSGSLAKRVGEAGSGWPTSPAPPTPPRWKWAYAASIALSGLLPFVALIPIFLVLWAFGVSPAGIGDGRLAFFRLAPLYSLVFVMSYALLLGGCVRITGRTLRPGWHGPGKVAWAGWTHDHLLAHARADLFPIWSTIYARTFARLCGIRVGRRAELSTAIGLSPLVRLEETSFVADDVVFSTGRSREGWLHLQPITVGEGSFIGNSAILSGGTTLGAGGLVGVQSSPPLECPPDTSWFGDPAIEFPRPAPHHDPKRTVAPPMQLVVGRAATDALRILLPITVSLVLGVGVLEALDLAVKGLGIPALIALAAPATVAAGLLAVGFTALVKWLLIGRYRRGDHPLWSFFVWRDEIVNSCQEMLAGGWLLDSLYGTRLMGPYLRLMGADVGRDVWVESLNITEFEMVKLGDGAVLNRGACPESHLFHDRVMSIGPISIGDHATIGPHSAVLPDTVIGDGCVLGARSVVLRGEVLPAGTRWHGSPVVAG